MTTTRGDRRTPPRSQATSSATLWPRIDWGAPGPGFVETEFQIYPFTVSLLYRVWGEDPLYGRFFSLALTGLAGLVFQRLARRFLGPPAALAATTLFLMAPVCFRFSRAFMPEATALLFYLLALDRFLAFLAGNRWRDVLGSAAAMCLAILVKPTTIHLSLALMILAIARGGSRSLLRPKLIVFGLVSLLPAAAYYAHAAAIHLAYGNTFGVISGGDSKWGNPK